MIEKLKNMPKVELHLHLDGSIPINLASKLSHLNKEKLEEQMIAPTKCRNLSEYLTKFDLPIQLMQTEENLTQIASNLVDELEQENVIYAEIRFAPNFHTKKGLSLEKVVDSVLKGLAQNKKVKTNLILCMMRGASKEENKKVIDLAEKYLNKGVCAIDLAGAEDKYPLQEYLPLFSLAKEKNIPFTIHAGENGNAKEVEKAIKVGAKRIGHGIHSISDLKVLDLIQEKDILLEICSTSNVQSNAIDTYANHPIKKLYQHHIALSINTDNRTVSNISLTEEYQKLYKTFSFSLNDYQEMNQNAILHSFLSDEEKEDLLKKLVNNI